MARRELYSDNTEIEQRGPIADLGDRGGDVILVDPSVASKDYQDELAFMETPVTIRLQPSNDVNALMSFVVYVNGKGAEVFRNGRWHEIAWLPVGETITIKRKYLEVIARTKIDTVRTPSMNALADNPDNRPTRFTSAVHSFSVLEDRHPRGAAWLTEIIRRNF